MNKQVQAYALRLLSRREYSQHELRQKLALRTQDNEAIQCILEMLQNEGLQSDARYCEMFIRTKMTAGFGPLWIKAALRHQGIEEALLSQCLLAIKKEWPEVLAAICRKKKFQNAQLKVKFLLRRGFPVEMIKNASF